MKAFGYKISESESESASELSEVSLYVTKEEIDKLIDFLQFTKAEFERGRPISGQAHRHFSHWSSNWNEAESDLIILYK